VDRFAGSGGSPFDLAAPDGRPLSLADVVRTQRPHDRSAGYLRYRSLGGHARLQTPRARQAPQALQAPQAIQSAQRVPLVTWDEHDWPSRLKALELAQERIVELGQHRSERIRVAAMSLSKPRIKLRKPLQIVLEPDFTSP